MGSRGQDWDKVNAGRAALASPQGSDRSCGSVPKGLRRVDGHSEEVC